MSFKNKKLPESVAEEAEAMGREDLWLALAGEPASLKDVAELESDMDDIRGRIKALEANDEKVQQDLYYGHFPGWSQGAIKETVHRWKRREDREQREYVSLGREQVREDGATAKWLIALSLLLSLAAFLVALFS